MTIPDVNTTAEGATQTTDSFTVPLDDGDIYLCQDGPRDAPALLLIHGLAASSHYWDPLVPMLTESHRVIRIDLLGHGQSGKSDAGNYGIFEQGRRVGATLDQLGVPRAVIVGHSTGGAVATALTEQRPGLVAALALINTGPHLDAYIAPDVALGPAQWLHLTDEQIRHAMQPAFSRAGYQIPPQLVDDVRGMTYHGFTSTMRASHDYLRQRRLPDRLADLGKPLLVIFGAEDRRWDSSFAADYHTVAGAEVELLPGVGHSPMQEDPSRTAAHLLAFTDQVSAGQSPGG